MLDLDTDELTRLRAAALETMQDSCLVGVRTSTRDGGGQRLPSYVDGSSIHCGLLLRGAIPSPSLLPDADLRLPYGTTVVYGDRITITHRDHVAVSPSWVYYVHSYPVKGISAVTCQVKGSPVAA